MGLDAVELIFAVEKRFGIVIPDGVAAKMITPAILISYVQTAVTSSVDPKTCWTHEEVRDVIRQIIREQLGIDQFDDEDEFVRDLGID